MTQNKETTVVYDNIEFSNGTELGSYIRLCAISNGQSISDKEVQDQVMHIIETQVLDESDEDDYDDRFVSLESLEDEELFDDYDMEHEEELNFN